MEHTKAVPSFKEYFLLREEESGGSSSNGGGDNAGGKRDWKKEYVQLEKGFVPPPKLRPVIEAFLESGDIKVMDDTTKEIKMPKKMLYLVGGAVRDFLLGKTPRDYNLTTDATPEQTAMILHKAGFRVPSEGGHDISEEGKKGPLKLSFEPKVAKKGWKKLWYIDSRDKSKDSKAYAVTAEVDGEKFVIETFRKGAKGGCPENAEFCPGADEDSQNRDFTVNSMYIELSKADGPNAKLHDPTNKGWHDAKHSQVRAIGKAEDRLKEDPSRLVRGIRLHSRMGKTTKMDPDIEKAVKNMGSIEGVDPSMMRDEFMMSLMHPDTHTKSFLSIFKRMGLLDQLLPGLEHDIDFPSSFGDKRDKPLALAWMLKGNDPDKIKSAFSSTREIDGEEKETGWSDSERRSVMYLLDLLGFEPEKRPAMQKSRKSSGLSKDQIKNWADMFNVTDDSGRVRNRRPGWAKLVRAFANNDKNLASEQDLEELGLSADMMDPLDLEEILDQLEIQKFSDTLSKE